MSAEINDCPDGCRVVCDRHRDLLARLEWNLDGRCNGCNGFRYESGSFPLGHEEHCWVAEFVVKAASR
jgi:hypothetical protein